MTREIRSKFRFLGELPLPNNYVVSLVLIAITLLCLGGNASATLGNDDRVNITKKFLAAYETALQDPDQIPAVVALMVPDTPCVDFTDPHCSKVGNAELRYAGAPGRVLPFAGTWVTSVGVTDVLTRIHKTSITNSYDAKEILPFAYTVDFTKSPPYIPEPNRVCALVKEFRTVRATGLSYRADIVALLSLTDTGLVYTVDFYYDSYVPSQAYRGDDTLIVNPDIDPVLNPLRDRNITDPNVALKAVLNFFGTFASVNQTGPFGVLANVVTKNCVISFAGDPRILPFADNKIRMGVKEVIDTFGEQLANSRPRVFYIQEFFVGGDRVVTNANELRFSTRTNRGYNPQVEIEMTVRDGLVGSVQGNFDSVLTVTAFTGRDPFDCDRRDGKNKVCEINGDTGFGRP